MAPTPLIGDTGRMPRAHAELPSGRLHDPAGATSPPVPDPAEDHAGDELLAPTSHAVPVSAAPALVDDAGTVVATLPCDHCAYDLQGLPAKGACPECGAAIAGSLDPDRPRAAPRSWLERLATATRTAGILLVLLPVLLLIGVPLVVGLFERVAVLPLILVGLGVGALLGRLVEPRPGRTHRTDPGAPVSRATMLVLATAPAAAMLAVMLVHEVLPHGDLPAIVLLVVGLCTPFVGFALGVRRVRRLVEREHRPGPAVLGRTIEGTLIGAPALAVVGLASVAVVFARDRATTGEEVVFILGWVVFMIAGIIAMTSFVVAGGWLIRQSVRIRGWAQADATTDTAKTGFAHAWSIAPSSRESA